MKLSITHLVLFVLCSSWGVALPVGAQEPQTLTVEKQAQSEALIQEAVAHYSAKRYEEAIEGFKKAYEIEEEPELLFNIARSYEKMSNYKEAVSWYELFFGSPGTTSEMRKVALNAITTLRQKIAEEEAREKRLEKSPEDASTTAEPEAAPGTDQAPADKAIPSTEPEPEVDDTTPSQEEGSPTTETDRKLSPLKIAGYSLLGAGVVGLVVGSVFGGLTIAAKNDYDDAGYDQDRLDHRDEMKSKALVSDIGIFSGAALVTVGGALLLVDIIKRKSKREEKLGERRSKRENSTDKTVTFTPSLMPENAGFSAGLIGYF